MKTTLILIVLHLLLVTTSFAKNNTTNCQISDHQILFGLPLSNNPDSTANIFENDYLAPIEQTPLVSPEVILNMRFEEDIVIRISQDNKIVESSLDRNETTFVGEPTIEEIISADQQLTEYIFDEEVRPLLLEPTIEDRIAEDHAITEINFKSSN